MKTDLSQFPDDVRDLIAPHMAADSATLDAIGVAIGQKRDEAMAARTSSGVETLWNEWEEAYVGIDDANRHEFQDQKWSKPMSMDGPVTTGRPPNGTEHKSTAFIRLTARYVDAGAAKLGEILLPADDKAFSFTEAPVPELIKAKEDTTHVVEPGIGPLHRPARPGETPPAPIAGSPIPAPVPVASPPGAAPVAAPAAVSPPAAGAPGAPQPAPTVPLTVKDLAEEHIEQLRKKAKAGETRIYNWMVESQYTGEMRKVIADASRLGVGVLKAPIPQSKRGIVVLKSGDGVEIQIKDRIIPGTEWADPWNIFPDPACGENIHNGDFIFDRDYMSARQVRDLKKLPGYIAAQIDKVLAEGPEKCDVDNDSGAGGAPDKSKKKGRYTIWFYYGTLSRDEMGAIWQASGKNKRAIDGEIPPDQKEVYAIVTMINDSVIRAEINPLDSGSFPYHSVPWQRRSGHWAGIGVAEQLKTPQKMVNAAVRGMLNNAGKSAGSQIVMDRGSLAPADGSYVITPDKIWFTTGDGIGRDVREMLQAIEIPNVTPELMSIIEFALKMAEESTSIPLITQGQTGPTTPETLGATQIQNSNANQLLRSIGYAFDDYITEPVVRQFYEWLLLDPDVPNEEKGEFTINAHGSIALVERAIQDQTVAQMGQMATQPIYGINPKLWTKEFLKSKRLDPAKFLYTPEEQQRIDSQPPPPAPPVQVAQIQADTAMKQLAAKQASDQTSVQSEERIALAASTLEGGHVQNDAKRVEAEQQRTLAEATVRLHELQTQKDLAMLKYANDHKMNLDQVNAKLAGTAMTLRTQTQLNAVDNAVDLHKEQQRTRNRPSRPPKTPTLVKPPGQIPGRAGDGRAFEQGP